MKKRFLSPFLLFLVFQTCFAQQQIPSPKLDEFRKFMQSQMHSDQIPGMTIGYISWNENNETLWVEGFGYSDLENNVAAKAETAYRLGSISKTMTATAVLQLVEQGKIDLDAEIQKYVPYFPKKKWPVTVRELLGHLGGISHYQNYDVEGRIKEHKTTREAIAIFENFDLVGQPGTYKYSSYGYNLLGAAVEGASGMSFGDFMTKNIWNPMEMKNTRIDDPDALIPNRARGYRILDGEIKNSEFVDMSSRFGAGGTRSTIPDVLKFAKALASGKILASKTVDMMFTSMIMNDQHFSDYGMGWGMLTINGRFAVAHTGSQAETRTVIYLFPVAHLAIAAASNQEDVSPAPYARKLYELLQNERWNLAAYTKEHKMTYEILKGLFNSGLAYYEQHQRAMTEDPVELKKAFAYVDGCLKSSKPETQKKIEEGRHPISGEPFEKVGSYMAATLIKSKGQLENYHRNGPLAFANDFISIDRNNNFPKSIVKQWMDSWNNPNIVKMRELTVNEDLDLASIQKEFQKSFVSASAYPDFSGDLANLAFRFVRKGVKEKALKSAEIGMQFYSDQETSNAAHGSVQAAFGDQSVAIHSLKKAMALNPDGDASAESLSDLAYEIAMGGNVEPAVRLMNTTVKLYPSNGKLYCDLSEAYLAQKDKDKALVTINKGLEIDPNLKCAKDLLAKVQQ
jgi:CubicO group peptidase (beta-lactamase class C family)/Flp pilus assembly protein TadD